MKSAKKIISIIISISLFISIFSVAFSASAVSTVNKSVLQYTSLNLTFEKAETAKYKCSVTNNKDKYIAVDANNEGEYYWLMVKAKKVTPKSAKPVITVYSEKDGKKTNVRKFQITVNAAKKIEMSNIKINKGTSREIKLKNPYDNNYRFEYNKKTVNIKALYRDGDYEYPIIKGVKKGKTTVKAYLEGTKKLIGSFTVTVGDYKASVKSGYQSKTIYFNKHIDSRNLSGGTLDISKAICHYHSDGVYSITSSNTKLIGTTSVAKGELNPKAVKVYSKKTGSTTLTVYEKRGKNKKKKIGTIKLTVKQAKDSKVYSSYREMDNDGIFYENFISPGDSYNLKNAVVSRYLNRGDKKYHFKASEYTFTAKSNRPDIISVDKNGVCHCLAMPDGKGEYPKITYTVKFSDGSKASGGGQFDIVDEDFWE